MTILYKVQIPYGYKDIVGSTQNSSSVLCKISPKNLVAFCVDQNLQSHLYVCDIVSPWQAFHIRSSERSLVNVLEWNATGELLFVSYKNGVAEIWSMKNNCVNTWQLTYSVNLPNEEIIAAKFFHNSKAYYFNLQKKDVPAYSDKFERMEQRATLTYMGGAPMEGGFLLTASGLIGAFTIPRLLNYSDNQGTIQATELNLCTDSISRARSFISHCSVSYCSTGCFNVAINNWNEPLIRCYKVSIERNQDDSPNIKSSSLPGIFLSKDLSESKEISHIQWCTVECTEVAFVVYNCLDGSYIEQRNLVKKHQPIHKQLMRNKSDFFQWEEWEITAKLTLTSQVVSLCLSKIPTESILAFATLRDNSVQVLEIGLKKIGSTVFEIRPTEDQIRAPCKLLTSDVTCLNQLLVLFDNLGQMYAMQIPSAYYDKNYKINPLSLPTALLEYSIVTGLDASDVLMLNLNNLDVLAEKITENFTRQPTHIRHFYYSSFLSLKSNICRTQSHQQDFDNLITLHSISITFKSLIRPSELNSQDKGPAETLSMVLSEPIADIDKMLCILEAKEFTVDPPVLQSIQPLIQWVADLALSILNKLPADTMKNKFNKKHGYDISHDVIAIGSIRELVVLIRMWGILNPLCLPNFTKSVENFDALPVIFRLLTRLMQNPNEPDEGLLDECSVLNTQILISPYQRNTPITLLNNHTTSNLCPIIFQSGVQPLALQDAEHEASSQYSDTIKDDVSNMHLGTYVKSLRQCMRCGFINNTNKITKTAALKCWYQRWLYCHCGGLWQLV